MRFKTSKEKMNPATITIDLIILNNHFHLKMKLWINEYFPLISNISRNTDSSLVRQVLTLSHWSKSSQPYKLQSNRTIRIRAAAGNQSGNPPRKKSTVSNPSLLLEQCPFSPELSPHPQKPASPSPSLPPFSDFYDYLF